VVATADSAGDEGDDEEDPEANAARLEDETASCSTNYA
jgi:hypothetical protein